MVDQDYQKFIEKTQKGLNTPLDFIDPFVIKAIGSPIKETKRIIAGEINEVYAVTTNDGQEVIVRIAHAVYNSFGKEKWGFEQCAKVGVPVPKVLLVEDLIGGGDKSICILSKLPGSPLNELQRGDDVKYVQRILDRSGALLAKMHTIKTKGFGIVDEKGEGNCKSWYQYLTNKNDDAELLKVLFVKHNLDPDMFDNIFEIFRAHKQLLGSVKPSLLHGDFSTSHIMVEGENITGILDFGNIKSGDFAYDLARWDMFYGDKTPVDWLLAGYDNQLGKDFKTRLELCKLHIGIGSIIYNDKIMFYERMKSVKGKLKESVAFFNK